MALLSTRAMIQRATAGDVRAAPPPARCTVLTSGPWPRSPATPPACSPRRSASCTVLYDLVTEMVHVLNPSAGLVWVACDGVTDLDDVVAADRRGHRCRPGAWSGADVAAGRRAAHRRPAWSAARRRRRPPVRRAARQSARSRPRRGARGARRRRPLPGRRRRPARRRSTPCSGSDDDRRRHHRPRGAARSTDGTVRARRAGGRARTYGSRHAAPRRAADRAQPDRRGVDPCVALHAGVRPLPDG